VSTFVGYRKPDARVFEHVATTLGVDICDLCLIDDQPRNVDGARAIGMDAILFRGADPLRDELVARGLLVSRDPL
jgi:HAD superfamily hydrolase (TIGR01509 family)